MPSDVGVILHHQRGPANVDAISDDCVIADQDVMRHVYVGHQKIAVADLGDHPPAFSAAMNRYELSRIVFRSPMHVVRDGSPLILFVLRRNPTRTNKGKTHCPCQSLTLAFEIDVRNVKRVRAPIVTPLPTTQ